MTDKKKKYDIVHKGVCSYPQTENFVAAKQFLIINEDGKRYLLVKLTNNRDENVTGATLFVEQFNERGDKIAADSVRVCGFDGYPQKSFAVEQKILVASTCIDCRITVTEAEFGKYTYKADDANGLPGYRFETEAEPEKKIPAEIIDKAGKNGVTVEPRSLNMPRLILAISIVILIAAFVAIWIYTTTFVNNEERFLHDGVYYSFMGNNRDDGSDIYVVGVRGTRAEISVPAEIDGHKVVSVDARAFLGNKNIKKVSFDGEIVIGADAFSDCTSLESIDLKNATVIATGAFNGCTMLRSVALEKIHRIGGGAFSGCSALTSITIADGEQAVTIGERAFGYCESLRTIDISRTIAYDKDYALFNQCWSVTSLHLKNFECGSSNRNIATLFSGIPFLKSIIIDNIDTVGDGFCTALPEVTTVRFNNVATPRIGRRAFFDCESLEEVIMPMAVTEVGEEAFSGTAIKSFDGSSLKLLGDGAFRHCKRLTTFTMHKDTELEAIGEAAFMGCEALGSVTIPTQVIYIRDQAFSGCKKLASVTFADDSEMSYIANSAFENCERLNAINIPASVRDIGYRAFAGCISLGDLALPAALNTIGNEAFAGSGLTKAELPISVTDIGRGAFYDCEELHSLTVPFVGGSRDENTNLSYIFSAESGSVCAPTSLTAVTITDSVVAPYSAFYGCTGLTSVVYKKGLLSVEENAFRGCSALVSLELADGIESIGEGAFSDCAALTGITLPDTINSIGRSAFSGCISLNTLITPFVGESRNKNGFLAYMFGGETYEDADKIPAALKRIELTDTQEIKAGAFFGTSVGEVVLGAATTAIGEYAFKGNRRLNMITLPEGLTDIGDEAFWGCYFLYEVYNYSELQLFRGSTAHGYVAYYALKIHDCEEVRMPITSYEGYDFVRSDDKWHLVRYPEGEAELVLPAEVVTEGYSFSEYAIHDRLFIDDKIITSVYIPSNAKSIGVRAFAGCKSLAAVDIADGVTVIESGAFSDCIKLASFVFPSDVVSIADDLFSGCKALKEVVLPPVVYRVGESAFSGCSALLKVEIPNDCTFISAGAFGGCTMLYDVNIPSECAVIGDGAFGGCGRIKSVTLPASLERIGSGAFNGCFRLYEVYNLSGYIILPGSEDYGGVAEYAYAVYASLDATPLCNTIVNGLHYYKLDEEWRLVDYYGTDGNIDICGFSFGAERVDDIVVIDYAFRYYDTIRSVKVGEQVSRIGSYAFGECRALVSVEIAAEKLVICGGAFAECKNLASLDVLSGDVEFGAEAFAECGLTYVALTGGDFAIMDNVFFDNTALDKLTVVCSSLSVYEMAFFNGLNESNIKCSIFTAENMAFYGSLISKLNVQADEVIIFDQNFFGGNIQNVDIVGRKSVHISSTAFNMCGNLETLSISGNKVDIAQSAFNGCADAYSSNGIGSMSIIGGEINISASAFVSCVVKSLKIEGSEPAMGAPMFSNSAIGKLDITCTDIKITDGSLLDSSTLSELVVRGKNVEISDSAFYMTGQLASLEVSAEALTIGSYAFFNQYDLKSVVLTANKSAEIGTEAFSECGGLEKLVLPVALNVVNERAFGNCSSLIELDIPKNVISIADYSFAGCNALEKLTLPSGLVSIGKQAFIGCNRLKSLTIPNTVKSIGASAFMFCNSLESLVLPSALKEIGEFTFFDCHNVTAITLPSNLTTVGKSAFYGCTSVKSLTIPKSVTKIDDSAFGGCMALETLGFAGAPELGFGAFSGCPALKSLDIPNGMTDIPFAAFSACSSLTSLTIPNSVTTIGDYAFSGCSSLARLVLPSGLTTIGEGAFDGCERLKELVANTTAALSIGYSAFSGCNSLIKLELNNIASIGASAFAECYKLERVEFTFKSVGNADSDIGSGAFSNCYELTSININADANTAVYIYSSAFIGCGKLTALNLPSTLCYIGPSAFYGCAELSTVELPSSLGTIGYNAFCGAERLFSVCNKSALNIEAGSDSNGGVAKYAVIVTDNRDKAVLNYAYGDKMSFVRADGVWYLYDCKIAADGYGLPESASTDKGVISSYIIKCRTFTDYIDKIVIPKSVIGIQKNAFDDVGQIYYKGTAEQWNSIGENMGIFFYISFYVDCVHAGGEWTEIDGKISTHITMSAWSVVESATCTEAGKRERHCDRCGNRQEQEIPINPFAHDYDQNGACKHCGVTVHNDGIEVHTHTDNEDEEQSDD